MASVVWSLADLTEPAVTVTAMRSHLREDSDDQDDVIVAAALAATRAVERFTQRALVQRQATLQARGLPCGRDGLRLPGGVVTAVTSVTIEGAAFTGFAVVGTSPAWLVPNADWPVVTDEGWPVTVIYTCGPAQVSADLLMAVRLLAAELYERRSDASEMSLSEVPLSARALMTPHRILPR